MADLVVTGPEPAQRWRRSLEPGVSIRIGRGPQSGWAVPWDPHVSREHFDLVWQAGGLLVRALDSARNAIVHQGTAKVEFALLPGDEFRIGRTIFQLVDAESPAAAAPAPPGEPRRTSGTQPLPYQSPAVGLDAPPVVERPVRGSAKLLPLRTLGKYEVQRQIGSGGMGTVYLATDTMLDRTVALKILSRELTSDPVIVTRFYAEARATAQLLHDNIVTLFDAGELEGSLFLALEYVEGTDLLNLIEKGGVLNERRSVDIVRQTALALRHAQERGLVHRDIKPSNLLLRRDGRVKLSDLGLARSMDAPASGGVTREGMIVGTVHYIAPEQAANSKAADVRSDIYSLGCTWYHMVAGQPPFPGENFMQTLYGHTSLPLPDPRAHNAAISARAVAVMHKMTEKEPSDRYQTLPELIRDLDALNPRQEAVDQHYSGGHAPRPNAETVQRSHAPTVGADAAEQLLPAQCLACGKRYKVRKEAAGRRFKCQNCDQMVDVPASG